MKRLTCSAGPFRYRQSPALIGFRHLFVEQAGMGLRPYVLWRRFVRAWELLANGESVSTAAHRAGFADSAHFARTSRQTFGFPPSLLGVARASEDA
jgi:AraC-like DNA-binding protein